jgi:hypothetical protein
MQKIKKLYRANYTGEDVINEMTYVRGQWAKEIEHIPNNIEITESHTRAVVLGNGSSRAELYPDLFNLLDRQAMHTYGCNAIMRDFTPDFVCANDELMTEFIDSGYCDQTIVYGTARMREQHPDKFYLVPQNPNWNMGSIATYLACFDGHKTVYLLGHDLHSGDDGYHLNVYSDTVGYPDQRSLTTEGYFERTMVTIMNIYNDVDFVRVSPTRDYYMPDSWKYQLNLRQISFRDFVIETDLR